MLDFAGRALPPDSSWQPPDEDNGNIVFRVLSLAWKNPGCGLVTWTPQIWRQTKIYLMEGTVKYKIVAVVRKIQNILERLQKGLLWLFEVCQSVIRTNLYYTRAFDLKMAVVVFDSRKVFTSKVFDSFWLCHEARVTDKLKPESVSLMGFEIISWDDEVYKSVLASPENPGREYKSFTHQEFVRPPVVAGKQTPSSLAN